MHVLPYLQLKMRRHFAEYLTRLIRKLLPHTFGVKSYMKLLSEALPLREVLDEPTFGQHVKSIRPHCPAKVVELTYPPNYPPGFRRSAAFPARDAFLLSDVVADPATGILHIDQLTPIPESYGSVRRAVCSFGDMTGKRIDPKDSIDGTIVCCPSTPYFHWVTEVLPQLIAAVRSNPNCKILVPYERFTFIDECLSLLNFEDKRIVASQFPVIAEEVFLLEMNQVEGFLHPFDLGTLRSEFISKEPTIDARERRLYISRRKNRKRRFAGESLLENYLVGEGFEVVHLQDIGFPEQIALMQQAQIVVGMHGAGLTNIIWAKAPLSVVEIFPGGYLNDCYSRLALSLGFDYRFVLASELSSDEELAALCTLLRTNGG